MIFNLLKQIPLLMTSLLVGSLFVFCINEPREQNRTGTIFIDIEGNGTVKGAPSDTTIRIGELITLSAHPDSGYIFTGWKTDRLILQNPLQFNVTGDFTITARFAKKPDKLVFIPALDSVFTMGSDNQSSQQYERPAHQVKFDHNFYMSPFEVTQGEYNALMSQSAGSEDSLPIGDITWYDAALYCNALSKSHGYDTVYTYSSICTSDSTCPFILENLVINYEKFGYRLPTEAEWEYACRAGSESEFFWGNDTAEKYAWYSVNSGNQSHKAGEKLPNSFGLYDMCGNVAEWVNDWLDSYPDTLLIDPVGPTHLSGEQFESSWERPVRGGSWRLQLSSLRSSTRRGPYSTSAFMAMTDIGFRIAMGSFQAATFKPSVTDPDSINFSYLCSKTDLINFLGTSRIKLALVSAKGKNRNLYIVDFCNSGIQVTKCGDDQSVYSPTISPDGRFVAYSSKGEGFSGTATLTIRPTETSDTTVVRLDGFLPRWWVSPTSPDTFLIFTSGASLNDLGRWYSEVTKRQRIQGGVPTGSPEVIWQSGSYHGGLSSDGRFLATAYPTARLVDLQINDTNIFYFRPPFNGRTDTAQVCNLSISPSKSVTDEAMFLDFGYSGTSTLLGKSYAFHSVLFICNSKLFGYDHVSKWFECPDPYIQWDATEWSNHPDFAVSLAITPNNIDNAAFIIKLSDSSYFKVGQSSTLSDPFLWIDPSEISETEDPYRFFGKYDIPVQTYGQENAAKKLRLFWHYRQQTECAVIGSSPAYNGIDPGVFSLPTINAAYPTADLATIAIIADKYILPHSPNLKVLIMELIPYSLDINTYTSRPPLNGLYESKGFELDTSMHFYQNGIPAEITSKISAYGQDDWQGLLSNGFLLTQSQGTGWRTFAPVRKFDYDFNDSIVQLNLTHLKNVVSKATAEGIQVMVVNFPQDPSYRDSVMIGCLGPSYETYGKVVAILDSLEQANSNFVFYDAGNGGNHDYTDDKAYDSNHLNYLGALKLSARLDSIITAKFSP